MTPSLKHIPLNVERILPVCHVREVGEEEAELHPLLEMSDVQGL
jgi:hypothetical protein